MGWPDKRRTRGKCLSQSYMSVFLIGSHFRTYRDSILMVIERLGSRYRVAAIIQ